MNLSDAEISVLELCRGRGLRDLTAAMLGYNQRLLNDLRARKLIRYRTLARDPNWVITAEGRSALRGGT